MSKLSDVMVAKFTSNWNKNKKLRDTFDNRFHEYSSCVETIAGSDNPKALLAALDVISDERFIKAIRSWRADELLRAAYNNLLGDFVNVYVGHIKRVI